MKYIVLAFCFFLSCSNSDDTDMLTTETEESTQTTDSDSDPEMDDHENTTTGMLYFPPTTSDAWETVAPSSLGWDETALASLDTYLEVSNTKAFMILKDGRIAYEHYFQGTNSTTNHRWNSAAKTLTATVVGIAQQEGYLDINTPSSDYLGAGWTAMITDQENEITIRHQLTMTTGGAYEVDNLNCTDPACLRYFNDPDTNWFYHNAFYILLQQVVTHSAPTDFNTLFETRLQNPIGMDGFWMPLGYARLYLSNARSMARFGLLNLNRGNWDGNQLINENYFAEMIMPSQDLNQGYGYLWWLNGKESYKLPGTTITFAGSLITTAPDDLYAGLGKDDQKLYVVPSLGLVVVRLGDAGGEALPGPSGYDTVLWEKIMDVVD